MKRVLVVSDEADAEASAVCPALSALGYLVTFAGIGRPSDMIAVLSGEVCPDADYTVICAHGDEGTFILPELAEEVYYPDEPHKLSADSIGDFVKLTGKTVISTACTTGNEDLAKAFTSKGNSYIAPSDYVEGSAALYFVLSLFYHLAKPGTTVQDAFGKAAAADEETALFRLFE